ncbi:MAG: type II toxin-antitoxin system RelE/ParE family toxin [Calditrichaceae bacterium]|nr:type II toxin-antitoxin system RelE/ParE family toxin [Calditrichia bacterium]NUQ41471.1 type II toxin-antitoxin system RelE/ParE family toxin [Calditrichaceae bacterium]
MFKIEFTPEAIEDIRLFRKHEQKRIIEAIENQLQYQPAEEARNRKRLRTNQLAEWELRIDKFRFFYDIEDESRVKIEAVGFKKGNILFIHGKEYKL